MISLHELKQLTPIQFDSIVLTPRGRAWATLGLSLFMNRLRSFYGPLPLPTVVVEEDDMTLCFFWECGGDPAVIRFDELSWDFV